MEALFVYGTLRDPKIRKRLINRDIPSGTVDTVTGFKLSSIHEDGQSFPILVKDDKSKELIRGEVLQVTSGELKVLDSYEGDLYVREMWVLESGNKAWVYMQPS